MQSLHPCSPEPTDYNIAVAASPSYKLCFPSSIILPVDRALDFPGGVVHQPPEMGSISPAVLWLQFAYSLWQFVRVAKFCRVPYALFVHTFMWIIGQWSHPFALKTYHVLETGRQKFYVNEQAVPSILSAVEEQKSDGTKKTFKVVKSIPVGAPLLACLTFTEPVNYTLCLREGPKFYTSSSTISESFVWNYLRDKPDCFAVVSDLLLPNFAILDRISDLEGLKMMCQGDYIPEKKIMRFLAVPDRENELNQNFMRLLSTIPLVAQAKGYGNLSVWISVAIIAVDQLSLFFNWLWELFKDYIFHVFKVFMIQIGGSFTPRQREIVCTFLSTISKRMMYSDQVVRNFIRVNKGDVVYTMSPFNLADFERITVRPMQRNRKDPKPYSEEEFGKFTMLGEVADIEPGTPIITHEVGGSKIHSIFSSGSFDNFINGEDLHLGNWRFANWGEDWDNTCRNNILDLLQIMEEMKMLPFLQTDNENFQSLPFNEFVSPDKSPDDITYLVAKKSFIIGGLPA